MPLNHYIRKANRDTSVCLKLKIIVSYFMNKSIVDGKCVKLLLKIINRSLALLIMMILVALLVVLSISIGSLVFSVLIVPSILVYIYLLLKIIICK